MPDQGPTHLRRPPLRHLVLPAVLAAGLAAWIVAGSSLFPPRPAPVLTQSMLASAAALVLGVVCAVRGMHRLPAVAILLAALALGVPALLIPDLLIPDLVIPAPLIPDLDSTVAAVHPNDLATLLALLVPWWLAPAAFGRREPGLLRCVYLGAAAWAAHRLWLTGSRGAVLATVAALVVPALLLRFPHSRRRRGVGCWAFFVLCLVAFVVPVAWYLATDRPAAAPESTTADRARGWLRDHDAEGATWRNLASGRPALWRQAAYVAGDFPLFGVGPGGFERLVPDAYPLPVRRVDLLSTHGPGSWRPEDAHNLYLETAAAFGLPALGLFAALCVLCLTRLAAAAREPEFPGRVWAAGACGGVCAYLLHGLGDCAAPGSAVYALAWLALGYGLAADRPGPSNPREWFSVPVVLAALVTLVGLAISVFLALPDERTHRAAAQSVASGETSSALDLDSSSGCDDAWWRDRLALQPSTAADVAVCAPRRIRDLRWLSPTDGRRAEAAYAAHPNHPDALLWRLWTLDAESASDDLVAGYLRYLAQRPTDADARMEFLVRVGDDWRRRHPRLELAFLAHACAHGDPGANACLRAGDLALRLGLGDGVADSFFLASEWPGARRKASRNRDLGPDS